jgi:glycosyltransferase involved in cell wall biosynthesis
MDLPARERNEHPLYSLLYKLAFSIPECPAGLKLSSNRMEGHEKFLMKALGIVIPTYNRSDALMLCLAHLERQTFMDFEVVVVDDGSTDSTQSKMQEYLTRSSLTIRYVSQQNGGPAKARNLGVSMLQSPVCLFLGDDIFASPTLVECHRKLHQRYPASSVAALGFTRWSTTGQEITPFMRWLEESRVQFAYHDLLAGAPPTWHHFYTSNLSMKTELLKRFPFNEEFPFAAVEDSELGYRLSQLAGLEIKFIPEAVADHLHPTTFRQACARMIRVGYSTQIFHRLWPETKDAPRDGLNQKIKRVIMRRPRLIALVIDVGNICSQVTCPDHLMNLALEYNFEVGYRSSRTHEGNLVARS